MKKNNIYKYAIAIAIFIVVVLFAFKILFFRLDLTEEKRFSITKATKNILKNIKSPIKVIIYIGEADANIAHLKNGVNDILDEFAAYSESNISYSYVNPADAKDEAERNKNFYRLEDRGLSPITISTLDAGG